VPRSSLALVAQDQNLGDKVGQLPREKKTKPNKQTKKVPLKKEKCL
jgi:hypothetical protein